MNRRDFLRGRWFWGNFRPAPEDEFFSSMESSYSITQAYPLEILQETARWLGIAPEGKSRLELARLIFAHRKEDEDIGLHRRIAHVLEKDEREGRGILGENGGNL